MATNWPGKRRLIGKKIARLDGPEKSTGKAKYSYDINRPGMLHAVIIRCPHAHATIKGIDTSRAEKAAGFKAVHIINPVGTELFYAGDEVLALAADTEEHAREAARLVKVDYTVLSFTVKEDDARARDEKTAPPIGPKKERQNLRPPQLSESENFAAGQKNGAVTVEGTYGMPVISHQCLESHGLVAEWGKDGGLTVWASTQAVAGTADALARHFNAAHKMDLTNKVQCITHYMGGGFGSKFGPDVQGIACAELALKAKAPVKLMLDRASEITTAGNRPSAFGKVRIAGKQDGTITAFEADTWGTPGIGTARTIGPLPYVYLFENKSKHTVVRLNTGAQRAMRAPGHPQSCFFTDCALDDFAAAVNLDPLEVRLKNLPPDDPEAKKNDPLSHPAIRGTLYKQQLELAAKLSNWKARWHPPGKNNAVGGSSHLRHGIGMALHTWGGQASPQANETTVLIASDGSVTAQSSTQDLGTAQRTVTAIVVAEVLGLDVKDINVQIGESQYGRSTGSGGSTTCPSQAPAALLAATQARDELFKLIARKLGAKPEDLEIVAGKIRDKASGTEHDWKKACARLGTDKAKGNGVWTFAESQKPENAGISKVGVGGVQVAEVVVDTETGVVRCTRLVAVQDCGLLINKLACESQVAGGVIMGLNYALFEELIADRNTGRIVNPDMEFYKLGGINDMPQVVVHMMDMPERGVIGIGEPPTISTHAAIGNAVFNALGVRVPETPFTPDRVLAALAKGAR
ncbi:MAG: xanthine dehydrogenase family protein molybdopterin-binding subunit [Gemmataceae bacterium]